MKALTWVKSTISVFGNEMLQSAFSALSAIECMARYPVLKVH